MGLPIVQEIFDGLRWIIDFFMNKVPKPIKFLIFLLSLLLFGTVLTFMLHLSGVHCTSDKEVVRVSIFKVATNFNIIWESTDKVFTAQTLSICDAHPSKCGKENECYFYAQKLDNGLYSNCNLTNATSECLYYLNDGYCHNCTSEEICFQESMFWIFCGQWHDVCLDDAYPSEYSSEFDLYTGCGYSCYVPHNYLWNITTGQYECYNETYCGVNATKIANPVIDEKLKRANAKLIYPDIKNKNSYTKLIYLKCDEDFDPTITVFGLPIFNYKYWVLLIVIYILVVVLLTIKKK